MWHLIEFLEIILSLEVTKTPEEDAMMLPEAIAYFLNACELEKNLTSRTLVAYASDLRQFQQFLRLKNIEEPNFVDSPVLHDYVAALKGARNLSDVSIRRKVAVLRGFYNFLEQRDLLSTNPFRKARFSFRQRSKIPHVLNQQEVMAILGTLKNSLARGEQQVLASQVGRNRHFVAARDNALLELLFYTGARVGEIVKLNLSDCDLQGGYVRFEGKGRRDRIVHLGCSAVTGSLDLYLRARSCMASNESALFLNARGGRLSIYGVEKRISRHARRANLNGRVTPHVFRHTMATMMLENGADLRTVQEILGHTSVRTTQIYTHISNEHKRRAMIHHHPRSLFWI